MKKYLISFVNFTFIIVLASWGPGDHSTICSVAEKHLTPAAANAVRLILNGQRMSHVSSWADHYRFSHPETAGWFFLNVTDGLSYQQFVMQAMNQPGINIYKILNNCITELSRQNTLLLTKQMDLKFLIHFVGDAHQPMNVGREIDRRGSTLPVTFLGRTTDLHSLWDGMLIHKDMSNYEQLTAKLDQRATPTQIQKWQSDGILQWLWESYQISTSLYQEAAHNPNFGHYYYTTHIMIAENRLEMGGIRLAGVLNRLFQ